MDPRLVTEKRKLVFLSDPELRCGSDCRLMMCTGLAMIEFHTPGPPSSCRGYFNKSDLPARGLFWVSPARKLHELFKVLHNMSDVEAVVRASAEHEVDFLPPEANG